MSLVTFISETGMPHSACHIDNEWLGFKPKLPKAPVWPGFVDSLDRTALIEYFVKFEIDTRIARRAAQQTKALYADLVYHLAICDCVSFTADLARACGVVVPGSPNLLPGRFIKNLAALNRSRTTDEKLPSN